MQKHPVNKKKARAAAKKQARSATQAVPQDVRNLGPDAVRRAQELIAAPRATIWINKDRRAELCGGQTKTYEPPVANEFSLLMDKPLPQDSELENRTCLLVSPRVEAKFNTLTTRDFAAWVTSPDCLHVEGFFSPDTHEELLEARQALLDVGYFVMYTHQDGHRVTAPAVQAQPRETMPAVLESKTETMTIAAWNRKSVTGVKFTHASIVVDGERHDELRAGKPPDYVRHDVDLYRRGLAQPAWESQINGQVCLVHSQRVEDKFKALSTKDFTEWVSSPECLEVEDFYVVDGAHRADIARLSLLDVGYVVMFSQGQEALTEAELPRC